LVWFSDATLPAAIHGIFRKSKKPSPCDMAPHTGGRNFENEQRKPEHADRDETDLIARQ
jgi:hypothetical protein